MSTRFEGRVEVVARALALRRRVRQAPRAPQRILIAHHLLLGDTLMLTPLVAKLRAQHPQADIAMTVPRAFAPLYATRPYGVRALPFDPHASMRALFDEAPFDLAIVPGDNRYAWLAAAMRARHIVAFAGDSLRRNWPVDELVPYADTPAAWGDLVARIVEGEAPRAYRTSDWASPACRPFDRAPGRYAVLHVGASSPLKRWPPERWSALANEVASRGLAPVWSSGPGEEALVAAVARAREHRAYAGTLDLAQLWHLLKQADLLVAPDTGVAHLGRVVGVPTVALFGPGSATLCGAGDFWRDAPYRAVIVDPFPCRDQTRLFRRDIAWVRRCGRSVAACPAHRCMPAIDVALVTAAVDTLLTTERAA
jgi:ADP-heptose:LPS heptosyltransferase